MGEGRVGLFAGGGTLPREAFAALAREGFEPTVFGFEGITAESLLEGAVRLRLGEVDALLAGLRAAGAPSALIVGHFAPDLAAPGTPDFTPDDTGRRLMKVLAGRSPVAWMRAIAEWLEEQGCSLLRQDEALAALLAGEGPLASRGPDESLLRDLAVGRAALEGGSPEDLTQAVAVRDARVVARESAEGTDALIRRAHAEAGPGITLVKGARPGQDPRLDLPAIGPDTVVALREAEAAAVAVDAGTTLVIERSVVSEALDEASLVAWGYRARDESGV